MKLSSGEYMRLIKWLGNNYFGKIFGVTKAQKILFICYGIYLAQTGKEMFEETPQAWPFGPVFPSTYHFYEQIPWGNLSEEEKEKYESNPEALKIVARVVSQLHGFSATRLSDWSHRDGSPWAVTIFTDGKRQKWGTTIDDENTKAFFQNANWKHGL